MKGKILIASVGFVAVALVCVSAQAALDAKRPVVTYRAAPEGMPGAVLVTADADGAPRFDCVGEAAPGRRMEPDTVFWMASNTKGVLAALVLNLVSEGVLSLDDPVEKYFPSWKKIPVKTRPTLRMLLCHTSGLDVFPKKSIARPGMEALVEHVHVEPLKFEPDTNYLYSNWDIDVAAAIVEKATGRSFEVEMAERIFKPLGMVDSTFIPNASQNARRATFYKLSDGKPPEATKIVRNKLAPPYMEVGVYPEAGGGLLSTPQDMARFFQMIARGGLAPDGRRLISAPLVEKWAAKQTPKCVKVGYSFGMKVDGKGSLSHGGVGGTWAEVNLKTRKIRLYMANMQGSSKAAKAFRDDWMKNTKLSASTTNDARIDEIAQWLPETPRADGASASDRAKWDALAATKEGQMAIRNAAKISGVPVPDTPDDLYLEFSRNGNRSNYQKCYFKRKTSFVWLYVGECLEHKGRFIPKIVEYMDAFCAMKSWTLPAHDKNLTCFNGTPHVDLCSAELSRELAFCLSWLGDAIPAATREKVYSEIDRRTFQPHLAHARGVRKLHEHWWFHGGNNWNSVCNSCVVRAALALIPDRRLRAEFVMHAEGSVPYALAGYTDDGYCSEGMGYWNYGYGHHVMMGLSLRAATGGKVDLFANPKTKTVMAYAYGFQLQGGKSPHFADGGGNPNPTLLALGRQVWPDLVSTAALNSPVLGFDTSYFSLRAFGQEPAPCAPTMDVLPPRSWFPNAQVLISRRPNLDGKLDWSVAIKGGHNAELHNHNDVGSYAIMLDGIEMCGDPGGEVYTRRTFSKDRYQSKVLNSYGHPVPVVGGKLQKGGRKAAAKVLRTEFTDGKDVVEFDCTAAYDVPALKSLVRTMTFDRAASTVTITDRVMFSEPTAFEVPVITYREWEKNADDSVFMFRKSPTTHRKMKMEVKASAPLAFTQEEIENPGRPSPQRLLFTFKEPVSEAMFTTVFSTR